MKKATLFILIIVAFATGVAVKTYMPHKTIDTMPADKTTDRKTDEEAIRKTEATYDAAWQQGNIDGLMACFANNAVLISPRGDEAVGKEQIRKLFSNFLGKEAKRTKHTSRITRIHFVTNDVAIVDGEALIEGGEDLPAAVQQHKFVDVLVRQQDGWLISQIRAFATR